MSSSSSKKFVFLSLVLGLGGTIDAQIFSEQGAAIGINQAYKARVLTGGGAAFFDFDNDGDEDLYCTGGLNEDALYQNNGDGTFSKITQDIGLNITGKFNTMGVATADLDNDGDREIFVTTWEEFDNGNGANGRNLLFNNNGNGTFTEIGSPAGLPEAVYSVGAIFLDYDQDGLLDIFVINHVEEVIFSQDSSGTVVGFDHLCFPNFLYKNNGGLTFTQVATEMGLEDLGCSNVAVPTDFDMDGDVDIYVGNDFGGYIVPNVLYENEYPAHQFLDISSVSGADIGVFAMGIAAGDYDQDLDIDYYITNIGRNALIENREGIFEDVTDYAGVANDTVPEENLLTTGWGTAFLDVDNDSWLDLFVSNGRIPALSTFATATNDPNKLFRNNGDKTFSDVTDAAGVGDIAFGRGMAYSDFDRDGDLDIFVVVLDELEGVSKFYVNETNNDNHYVQFKLVGQESNRDAFGSKIWLYAGGQTFLREIYGGGASYCSQHSSIAHFGLNNIAFVDSIRIDWTNGHSDLIKDLSVDSLYTIEENVTVTAVREVLNPDGLLVSVSPNPFDSQLSVQIESKRQQEAFFQLFKIEGAVLFRQKIFLNEGQTRLEIPNTVIKDLTDGLYLLTIRTEEAQYSKKIVKLEIK